MPRKPFPTPSDYWSGLVPLSASPWDESNDPDDINKQWDTLPERVYEDDGQDIEPPTLKPRGVAPLLPIERFADIEPRLINLWAINRLLPAIGLVLIYGHPNSGKSFFALYLALYIALGWKWRGRKVRQGLVIYVGAEGVNGLRNRIVAFRQHHAIGAIPFSLIPAPINLQDPRADVSKLAQTIQMEAKYYEADPVLIVIDTLSKTFGAGQENTDDMAVYIANCASIAAQFNCCVMPVHHRPKDQESRDPRGHSSLKAGVDTTILIEGGVTKSAEIIKQRDGEIGERFPFNLRVVELGEDEDGDQVTSCIVEEAEVDARPNIDPFTKAVGSLSNGNRMIYDQLGELIATNGIAVPASIPDTEINQIRVGKVALLDAWRDKCISAAGTGSGHNRDTAKRTFNRAKDALRKKGIIRVWEEFCWITHRLDDAAGQSRDSNRD